MGEKGVSGDHVPDFTLFEIFNQVLRMKNAIIIAALTIICFSCEKNITEEFSKTNQPKIALSGEIIALENPMVNLSRTITMTDLDTVVFLNNAIVEIESGDDVYLMNSIGNGYYLTEEFVAQPGETYTVSCSVSELPSASASVRVPELPALSNLTYTVDEDYVMHFTVDIDDPADLDDYYAFYFLGWGREINHQHYFDSLVIDTTTVFKYYSLFMEDPVMEYTGSWRRNSFYETDENGAFGSTFYFTDKLFIGASYQLSVDMDLRRTYNDSIPEIEFNFIKRDEYFFNYFKSILRNNTSSGIDSDLPIMQPVHVYSNIDGGFGLLTASSRYSQTIDMSEWYDDPDFIDYLNSQK